MSMMKSLLNHCISTFPLASSGQIGADLCYAGLGQNQFAIKQVAINEFAVKGYSETNFGFSDCVVVGAVSWFAT